MSPTTEVNTERSKVFLLLEQFYNQFDNCQILNQQNMLLGRPNSLQTHAAVCTAAEQHVFTRAGQLTLLLAG